MSKPTHATLRYSLLRLGVFLGVFAVIWVLAYVRVLPFVGPTGALFIVILSGIISAPLSYVLLSRQRDAMSSQIINRVQRNKSRFKAAAANEDEADDAHRAAV
jgi:hypothetical protein